MPVQKISKEEILSATLDAFRQKGYYNTSMEDLAQACGLHKGSFYHHFSSKEALMKTILEEMRNQLNQYVFSIAFDEKIAAEKRMTKLLMLLKTHLLAQEGGCFIGNTTLETAQHIPQFADILRGIFADWTAALQKIYSVRYANDVAFSIAQQTVMEFQGAVMMRNLFKDEAILQQSYERAMQRLVAG